MCPSLKDWMLQSTANESSNEKDILLMDGGVSTHLEHLLEEKGASFPHRALWSSSLLLTPSGRDWIQRGHIDWLEAGSDILTTVTYQCHYGTLHKGPPVVANENEYVVFLCYLASEYVENRSFWMRGVIDKEN